MTQEFDFYLYTDGSGHADGFGGWSALVLSPRHNIYQTLMAGHSKTSVDRAEFHGLLDGLQLIMDAMDWHRTLDLETLERNPPTVFWLSDRESLVKSVQRDETGNPVYGRKNSPDLWARFSFYERLFRIVATFTPRDTIAYHNIVDRFASDARVLIKDYMQMPENHTGPVLVEAARQAATKP
jgi:hypothetical protein